MKDNTYLVDATYKVHHPDLNFKFPINEELTINAERRVQAISRAQRAVEEALSWLYVEDSFKVHGTELITERDR